MQKLRQSSRLFIHPIVKLWRIPRLLSSILSTERATIEEEGDGGKEDKEGEEEEEDNEKEEEEEVVAVKQNDIHSSRQNSRQQLTYFPPGSACSSCSPSPSRCISPALCY